MDLQEENHTISIQLEPLRFNAIGCMNFDIEPGEEGLSLPHLLTDLTDSTLKEGFDSSAWFDSSTLWKWCGGEFNIEAADSFFG